MRWATPGRPVTQSDGSFVSHPSCETVRVRATGSSLAALGTTVLTIRAAMRSPEEPMEGPEPRTGMSLPIARPARSRADAVSASAVTTACMHARPARPRPSVTGSYCPPSREEAANSFRTASSASLSSAALARATSAALVPTNLTRSTSSVLLTIGASLFSVKKRPTGRVADTSRDRLGACAYAHEGRVTPQKIVGDVIVVLACGRRSSSVIEATSKSNENSSTTTSSRSRTAELVFICHLLSEQVWQGVPIT